MVVAGGDKSACVYVCVVAPKRKRESRKRKGYGGKKLGRRKGVREREGWRRRSSVEENEKKEREKEWRISA